MSRASVVVATLSLLLNSAAVVFAQQAPGSETICLDRNGIEKILAGEGAKLLAQDSVNSPLQGLSSTQLTATSLSPGSPSLVDSPRALESLLAAFSNDLLDISDGSLSLSLNLYALKSGLRPTVVDKQALYGTKANQRLRRFNGTLDFGGKGDSLDQDGDGVLDAALNAERLDDIVTWSVSYRFFGSRDRRDPMNFERYLEAAREAFDGGTVNFESVVPDLWRHLAENGDVTDDGMEVCAPREALADFFGRTDVQDRIRSLVVGDGVVKARMKAQNQEIDNGMIWSVVAGGVERDDRFGPRKRMIGLRGLLGRRGRDLTVNLDWTEVEGLTGLPDATTWKVGVELSTTWLKGRFVGGEGMKASISGNYELLDHVPDSEYDTIARANAKLEIPLADGIVLPLSVTWANHTDLLNEEDVLTPHLALAFDFSKLIQAAQ